LRHTIKKNDLQVNMMVCLLWQGVIQIVAYLYLAKAFYMFETYPPHKWDGNEFSFIAVGFSQRNKVTINKALAKIGCLK